LITLLDYGMGNLRSVEKAILAVGGRCVVRSDLAGVEKLVIPGVGAFGAAMERLLPMRDEIRRLAIDGIPVLGICLGQQLLFETGQEMGEHQGLGLLPGEVVYLPKAPGLKIPHMGWSPLRKLRPDGIMASVRDGDQVYFVHSLVTRCADPSDVAAFAEHGTRFAAAVQRGSIWGAQFHPEKSGDVGLGILRSFVEC
jgi:imidazole glycerol-phosphate synthase subunit HisH